MMGLYTEIIEITAPSEAPFGAEVSIKAKVRNISDRFFFVSVTGRYDGVDIAFKPDSFSIGGGGAYSFTSSFTMPNKSVKVDVWSYYYMLAEWHQDDHDYVNIARLESQFRNITIDSIEPKKVEVGDTVRITARVEHRGAGQAATIYAAIGIQGVWFDELLYGQRAWSFAQSSVWEAYYPWVDILITSAIPSGVYDAYVKVKAPLLVSPTVYDCITVVAVPTKPEFKGFALSKYTK